MISPNRNPTPPETPKNTNPIWPPKHRNRIHYSSVRQCKNKGMMAKQFNKKQKQTKKKSIMQVGIAWGLGAKMDDVSAGAD
jgi:hypothetical protein